MSEAMDIEVLPRNRSDILPIMEALHAAGPPAIARLAAVCLWLYGQEEDLSTENKERDYLKHIESLFQRISQLEPEDAPKMPFEHSEHYLTPRLPRQRAESVPAAAANARVEAAIREISQACSPGRAHVLACERLLGLWEQGVSLKHLEPVVEWMIAQHKSLSEEQSDFRDRFQAAETLMRVGEWERGLGVFDSFAPGQRAQVARELLKTGRADLARALLVDEAEQVQSLAPLDIYHLATAWAYLGEWEKALQLSQRIPVPEQYEIGMVTALVLGRYYVHGIVDPVPLVALLPATVRTEPLRDRLREQSHILGALLLLGSQEEIAQALDYIRATLLAPDWCFKYGLRLGKLADLLWQYRHEYPTLLYAFISRLLVDGAQYTHPSNRWPLHYECAVNFPVTVACLEWFIWHWAGPDEVKRVVEIIAGWCKSV